jgi:hypothetical protein
MGRLIDLQIVRLVRMWFIQAFLYSNPKKLCEQLFAKKLPLGIRNARERISFVGIEGEGQIVSSFLLAAARGGEKLKQCAKVIYTSREFIRRVHYRYKY